MLSLEASPTMQSLEASPTMLQSLEASPTTHNASRTTVRIRFILKCLYSFPHIPVRAYFNLLAGLLTFPSLLYLPDRLSEEFATAHGNHNSQFPILRASVALYKQTLPRGITAAGTVPDFHRIPLRRGGVGRLTAILVLCSVALVSVTYCLRVQRYYKKNETANFLQKNLLQTAFLFVPKAGRSLRPKKSERFGLRVRAVRTASPRRSDCESEPFGLDDVSGLRRAHPVLLCHFPPFFRPKVEKTFGRSLI